MTGKAVFWKVFSLFSKTLIFFFRYCRYFSGGYFDEISQDTGQICFGVADTIKSLEMVCAAILKFEGGPFFFSFIQLIIFIIDDPQRRVPCKR